MPTTTAGNKAKGRRLQQWVAKTMLSLSSLSSDDVVSRPMGSNGEDLMLSAAAREVFPLSIECANQERLNLWAKYKQAKSNAPEGTLATVIAKKNGERAVAIVDAEAFLHIIYEVFRGQHRGLP